MKVPSPWIGAGGALALIAGLWLVPVWKGSYLPAVLLLFLAGFALGAWLLSRNRTGSKYFSREDFHDTLAGLETPHIFALGKLFEATLGGMREGLLVVDRDLRVVASNPAAYQLFTGADATLHSQRLTEL